MQKLLLRCTCFLFVPTLALAQTFSFEPHSLSDSGAPGELLIIDADIINLTQQELQIRVIRVEETLPTGWSSSLCSGQLCFPPDTDMFTIPDENFGIPPLGPGETSEFHLNLNTAQDPGEGTVVVRVENADNPADFVEVTFSGSTQDPTGIEDDQSVLETFRLHDNFPNPFNPTTTIPFEIGGAKTVNVQLTIYNLLGQKTVQLINEPRTPGEHTVRWDARDQVGRVVPSGLYFYEIQAGPFRDIKRMMLMK